MNITSWDIYWITRLDSIKNSMIFFIILIIIVAGVFFFAFMGEAFRQEPDSEEASFYLRCMKFCGYLLLIPVFLLVAYPFIPTTKEACMIYAVPKLADSECVKTLQGDAKELYTLGIERLKAELAVKGGKDDAK